MQISSVTILNISREHHPIPVNLLPFFKSQRQLVALRPGDIGVDHLDTRIIDDGRGVVSVDGREDKFHLCLAISLPRAKINTSVKQRTKRVFSYSRGGTT